MFTAFACQAPQVELGLHESLLTQRLREELAEALAGSETALTEKVDDEEQAHVLARHVQAIALQVLAATKDPEHRLAIANDLVRHLERSDSAVVAPASQLMRIDAPAGPGTRTYEHVRPSTPLCEAALLTNAHDEPSLGAELRAEIDTADEVDLLCAFVKWHGLRLLEPQLRRLRERGAPFRVITTTYMGATERAALDRLVREFGAEVKIQYDAQRTRLHAKAWMFRRNTGFDTAYVGSSNLSRAALLDGVEWNVRLSRVGTPACWRSSAPRSIPTGTTARSRRYDPDRDRDRLDDALAEASGRTQHDRVTISLSGLEVRPFPYQQEMLEAIEVERTVHDRHRNLVVAATGTGKTVIAALDYRRLCQDDPQATASTALRRTPPGDPGAVASHLPRGPGRRELRRALRRRRATRALAACLRQRPVADVVRRREHPAPTPSTSWSSTSSTTPRPRPTGDSSTTSPRGTSRADRNA